MRQKYIYIYIILDVFFLTSVNFRHITRYLHTTDSSGDADVPGVEEAAGWAEVAAGWMEEAAGWMEEAAAKVEEAAGWAEVAEGWMEEATGWAEGVADWVEERVSEEGRKWEETEKLGSSVRLDTAISCVWSSLKPSSSSSSPSSTSSSMFSVSSESGSTTRGSPV